LRTDPSAFSTIRAPARVRRMADSHTPSTDIEPLRPGPAELPHRFFVGRRRGGIIAAGTLWHVDHAHPARSIFGMAPDDHSYAPPARRQVRRLRHHHRYLGLPARLHQHLWRSTSSVSTQSASAGCAARCATINTAGCRSARKVGPLTPSGIHHPDRADEAAASEPGPRAPAVRRDSWPDALDIVAEQYY